jgi:hypothetical protein
MGSARLSSAWLGSARLGSAQLGSAVTICCAPAVATRTLPRTALPTPTLLYQWREVLTCQKCKLSLKSAAWECRGIVRDLERPIAMQGLPALWTHTAKLRIHTPISRVRGLPPLRWLLYTTGTAPVLWLWGKPHGELPGLCEVGRSEGRSCKADARLWPKERRHRPPCRSESPADRALCLADGPGRGLE